MMYVWFLELCTNGRQLVGVFASPDGARIHAEGMHPGDVGWNHNVMETCFWGHYVDKFNPSFVVTRVEVRH